MKSSLLQAIVPQLGSVNSNSISRTVAIQDANNHATDLSREELTAQTASTPRFSRALCGQLDIRERGHQSFYQIVDMRKTPQRACSLKRHFKRGTCAHELVGYLESEEERIARPDRHLFHRMDRLIHGCFKGARAADKNFSRRNFFYAMRILRKLGIVSPRVERDGREGIIVAPHAALCHRTQEECRFVGPVEAVQEGVGRFVIREEGDGVIWHP